MAEPLGPQAADVQALLRRGWAPTPLTGKKPYLKEWQMRGLSADELPKHFGNGRHANVGVILGAVSGGLTDIDLDAPEAVALAPQLLPATGAVFGRDRPGKQRSHWLYACEPVPASTKFTDPLADDDERAMLVEVRADGCQTMVPPSIHPDGFTVEWNGDGEPEPATVSGADLLRAAAHLAAAVLLARHWPGEGNRQDAALALAGGLLRAGWDADEAEAFISDVAEATGDDEASMRAATVPYTAEKLAHDQPVTGWSRLGELTDERVVSQVRVWLGVEATGSRSLTDFHAHLPDHKYINRHTGELWPAVSVDASVPAVKVGNDRIVRPSRWLDTHRAVEQLTWAPGQPELIRDRVIAEGGWIEQANYTIYNTYRPALTEPGDPNLAGPWVELGRKLYPEHADRLIQWFAHRVQRPHEKPNHALVLGGRQGIGKDSWVDGAAHALGTWNCREIAPDALFAAFNGYVKAVILRVSEARDLGDVNRYALYERSKTLLAAPPYVLTVNEKYMRPHVIPNVVGVIFTTNHRNGLYLPADDRRHFVVWSEVAQEDFESGFWPNLWCWYEREGFAHVAAYLRDLELSGFNPKAPPPKTPAFWQMVESDRSAEDDRIADALESLGWPPAVTVEMVAKASGSDDALDEWLSDHRNYRKIPHRFERAGYIAVRNEDAPSDGKFKVNGKRKTVFVQGELSGRERASAARALSERGEPEWRACDGDRSNLAPGKRHGGEG